jgi:hypothetical protein
MALTADQETIMISAMIMVLVTLMLMIGALVQMANRKGVRIAH